MREKLLGLLLLTLATGAHAAPVKDDLGRTVNLRLPVRRVVSLSPSVSENLFAIGAGDRVVGATTADDYPAAVKKIPRVGNFYQPAYERLRTLRPDVVIVDSATIALADARKLEARLKVPVFVQKTSRFDDVLRHLEQLGSLTGSRSGAARAIAGMKAKAARAAALVRGKPLVTVFVQVDYPPLYAAGPGTYIDDLLRRARGTNIVTGTNPFPVYSREALLAANPRHYIVTTPGPPGSTARPPLPAPLNRLDAVRAGRVHYLSSDIVTRPTPRLADGLLALARALHP